MRFGNEKIEKSDTICSCRAFNAKCLRGTEMTVCCLQCGMCRSEESRNAAVRDIQFEK